MTQKCGFCVRSDGGSSPSVSSCSVRAPPVSLGWSPGSSYCFFFSSRRRHTRYWRDWSSDVCSSDLGQALRLSYNILQAAGSRIFKTDYVACPSCGRTLFNLQETTARIKAATSHLKGVKIAIMGCIVNGPGEMADADFGYVGGAPGKINLYVGKTAVKFNIPQDEAVDRLKDLIREHNKWVDPAPASEVPAGA